MPRYIRMEHLCDEAHHGRPQWVAVGHLKVQQEHATFVGAAGRARDACLPVAVGLVQGRGADTLRRVRLERCGEREGARGSASWACKGGGATVGCRDG